MEMKVTEGLPPEHYNCRNAIQLSINISVTKTKLAREPHSLLCKSSNSCATKGRMKTSSRLVDTWIRVNDPSAGSPTERWINLRVRVFRVWSAFVSNQPDYLLDNSYWVSPQELPTAILVCERHPNFSEVIRTWLLVIHCNILFDCDHTLHNSTDFLRSEKII